MCLIHLWTVGELEPKMLQQCCSIPSAFCSRSQQKVPAGIIAERRLQLTCVGATSLLQLRGHVRMIFTLMRVHWRGQPTDKKRGLKNRENWARTRSREIAENREETGERERDLQIFWVFIFSPFWRVSSGFLKEGLKGLNPPFGVFPFLTLFLLYFLISILCWTWDLYYWLFL